jgi:cytochrome c oxidase subunit II
VYVVTMAAILIGALRMRRLSPAAGPAAPEIKPEPGRERALRQTFAGAVVATVVLLFVLLGADVLTARAIHRLPVEDPDPLVIKVTGHQWWWEVQYSDPLPSNIVTTANEIHIPANKVVKFEIRSTDVIHSFWIPNLSGKKDMIPGRETSVWMKADQIGTFAGECAEFCGQQHAKMRFNVVVERMEDFNAWLSAQRQSAPEPATDLAKRGQQVFLSTGRCFMCHTVTGTTAGGRMGPDLTHLASRPTIAAGALPNAPGHLAGWIVDPQRIKPGTKMTQNPLEPGDLQALLEYLGGLK